MLLQDFLSTCKATCYCYDVYQESVVGYIIHDTSKAVCKYFQLPNSWKQCRVIGKSIRGDVEHLMEHGTGTKFTGHAKAI